MRYFFLFLTFGIIMANVGHAQDTISVNVFKNTKDYYDVNHQDALLAVITEKSEGYKYIMSFLDFKKRKAQKSALKSWAFACGDDLYLNMEYFEYSREHVFFKLDLKGRYGIVIMDEILPAGLVNSTTYTQTWFGSIDIGAFPGWENEDSVLTRIIIVDTYYRKESGKYNFSISNSEYLTPSFLSTHLRINKLTYKGYTYDQITKDGHNFTLKEVLEIIDLLNSNYE